MELTSYFKTFEGKRILVLGDVMLDSYIRGKVSRVSPEAPVPIVQLESREDRLGGAANVALNLVALGANPVICSVIGDDAQSEMLIALLKESGISAEGVIQSKGRKTTVKTRVIGNHQHLLLVDEEQIDPISASEEEQLISKVGELLTQADGMIFEDYNKGVLTGTVIRSCSALSRQHKVFTAVDPKKENFFEYMEVDLFKPNLKELKEGLGVTFEFKSNKEAFLEAVNELESRLNNKISLITLSEHGVFFKEGENLKFSPAHIRNISDVSGAGDTVIAVVTLAMVSGMGIELASKLANLAGGLVCEKIGVVPIDKDQLLAEGERLM